MVRPVEYHSQAKAEIQEAIKWYDDKVEGLGLEFLFEVRYAESKIIQAPEMWPTYEGETRRYLLKRFPFGVIYLTSDEKIQIVAVAHYKRKPGYWKKRLKDS
ncbi:MAG: type II toxin-antitoxin system RelE/ParE family toxin [bacterium]